MDDEDLKSIKKDIQVVDEFYREGRGNSYQNKRARLEQEVGGRVVDLFSISAPADCVGVAIMKKMGWRQGQGIGPRRKRNVNDIHAAEVLFAPVDIKIDVGQRVNLFGLGYDLKRYF